jgi:hypothetical protein
MFTTVHKKIIVLTTVLLLLAAIPLVAGDKVKVGAQAPEFKLPVVLSDSTITLSDFVNKKIVIVHFWKSR